MHLNFLKKIGKKTICALLVVAVVTPAAFSVEIKKTEAAFSSCATAFGSFLGVSSGTEAGAAVVAVPVTNPGQQPSSSVQGAKAQSDFLKDCVEETFAVALGRMILQRITDDIVNWINSGFNGSPAFISNPEQFLLDSADEIAGAFILDNDTLGFLCSPFKLQIQLSLALNYSSGSQRRARCTLSQVVDNVENAYEDFSEGGWGGWFAINEDQNNPYGSYLSASSQMSVGIVGAQNKELLKADWGSGFLSWEECRAKGGEKYKRQHGGGSVAVGSNTSNSGSADITERNKRADAASKAMDEAYKRGDDKAYTKATEEYSTAVNQGDGRTIYDPCEIQTPGKLIGETLSKAVGDPVDKIGFADSFDKIFNALAFQLIKQGAAAFGLGGNGIVGRSGNPSNRNTQLLADMRNSYNQANADYSQYDSAINADTSANKGATGQNIAVRKLAQQSSVFSGHDASNLTDGNIKSSYSTEGDYMGAMTRPGTDAWMQVDLDREYSDLAKVIIYQRTNPGSNSTENQFVVKIQDKNKVDMWKSEPQQQDFSGPIKLVIPPHIKGQYIRLESLLNARLEISEIELYQSVPPTIKILGDNPLILSVGDTFDDDGATAVDDTDGDITDKIKTLGDLVETDRPETFEVIYTVENSRGVTTEATRRVIIQQKRDVPDGFI